MALTEFELTLFCHLSTLLVEHALVEPHYLQLQIHSQVSRRVCFYQCPSKGLLSRPLASIHQWCYASPGRWSTLWCRFSQMHLAQMTRSPNCQDLWFVVAYSIPDGQERCLCCRASCTCTRAMGSQFAMFAATATVDSLASSFQQTWVTKCRSWGSTHLCQVLQISESHTPLRLLHTRYQLLRSITTYRCCSTFVSQL